MPLRVPSIESVGQESLDSDTHMPLLGETTNIETDSLISNTGDIDTSIATISLPIGNSFPV